MSEPPPPNPQQPLPPPPGTYGYPYVAPPPNSGKAITALVLGIVGLGMCPLTSIPAIFIGRSATREIDASQGRLGGRGMATAGFVLGIVGTVLCVLIVIGFIGLLVLGTTVGNSFDTNCTTTDSNDSFSINCD